VDLWKVAGALEVPKREFRLATPEECVRVVGYPPGSAPPVGLRDFVSAERGGDGGDGVPNHDSSNQIPFLILGVQKNPRRSSRSTSLTRMKIRGTRGMTARRSPRTRKRTMMPWWTWLEAGTRGRETKRGTDGAGESGCVRAQRMVKEKARKKHSAGQIKGQSFLEVNLLSWFKIVQNLRKVPLYFILLVISRHLLDLSRISSPRSNSRYDIMTLPPGGTRVQFRIKSRPTPRDVALVGGRRCRRRLQNPGRVRPQRWRRSTPRSKGR